MNENIQKLKDNIFNGFVGKEEVVENVIIALLSGGHLLIEDVPGVGKTTLAKLLAKSVDVSLARIQFTPDTLPSDIIGVSVFDAETSDFRIVKGPIHNQIVIADEINRASPKTQSALLEAMEEKQVTIDGQTFPLKDPFMVIATENPAEHIGTYPLPEAELDRFLMKLSIGYPDMDNQKLLAKKYLDGVLDEEVKTSNYCKTDYHRNQQTPPFEFQDQQYRRYHPYNCDSDRTVPERLLVDAFRCLDSLCIELLPVDILLISA